MGGIAGLLLGIAGVRFMAASLAAVVPSYWAPVVDARVLAVSFGAAALAGLLFGLSPAWLSFKVNLSEVVKEGGRGSEKFLRATAHEEYQSVAHSTSIGRERKGRGVSDEDRNGNRSRRRPAHGSGLVRRACGGR